MNDPTLQEKLADSRNKFETLENIGKSQKMSDLTQN